MLSLCVWIALLCVSNSPITISLIIIINYYVLITLLTLLATRIAFER